ncbi:MAG: N-acetyltransferase [Rhodobacterales bacterium]|nr:MAG: N-acetyltransferase [Rhodobacterales bacterium]
MIATPRLTLLRARMTDLDDVHAMLSQPAAMRYWSTPEHETLEESRDWLEGMVGAGAESDDFLIEHQGRVIGKAGAWRLPEVGFLLHPDHWGKGLAFEAMTAVIAHLFASHDLPELTAEADPRNAASLKLLGRLGFVETGRAERTMQWRDEWCDSVYLALRRPG